MVLDARAKSLRSVTARYPMGALITPDGVGFRRALDASWALSEDQSHSPDGDHYSWAMTANVFHGSNGWAKYDSASGYTKSDPTYKGFIQWWKDANAAQDKRPGGGRVITVINLICIRAYAYYPGGEEIPEGFHRYPPKDWWYDLQLMCWKNEDVGCDPSTAYLRALEYTETFPSNPYDFWLWAKGGTAILNWPVQSGLPVAEIRLNTYMNFEIHGAMWWAVELELDPGGADCWLPDPLYGVRLELEKKR